MTTASAVISGDNLTFSVEGLESDPITKFHLAKGTFYELGNLRRLTRIVERLINSQGPGLILDVGANIGNHTLYFGGRCPNARVVSFEMNPLTFAFLSRNVASSGLLNVEVYNKGLSSKQGVCGVKSVVDNPLGGAQLDFSEQAEAVVQLTTVDNYISLIDRDIKCLLMKIDVEGHELEVLKGALQTIRTQRPLIYLEIKEIEEFRRITDLLASVGYTAAYAEAGALPNFLFLHKSDLRIVFTEEELDEIRSELCFRVVQAWQLHRKIKILERRG